MCCIYQVSLTETLLSWLADAQVVLGEEDAEAAAEEVQALIAEARSTSYYQLHQIHCVCLCLSLYE